MSNNKEFSSTSANRYSLAQCEENSLAFLNLINNNKDFDEFIKDPTIKKDILMNVINKISENSKLDILFKNFLGFLITKRRFFFVENILNKFNEICSDKKGELKAEIKSAKELSQIEIDNITEELSKNFKSKIKLNYKYDQSLIGGLVVQVGSTMIDTSIKNKLQLIENRMIEA